MPVKTNVRPVAAAAMEARVPAWSASAEAARRRASGWPLISAMNGSGKFPNDFIGASVRCRRHGCEGRGRRWRQHVHAGARRGVRDPRRPSPGGRAGAARHRPRASRRRRRPGRAHDAQGRLVGSPHPHRRPRRGDRRRRLRDRAAPGGREPGSLPGRDDPAHVRVHRPGDDRSRRVRQGAADGAGGAGARRAHGRARRARRVVRGLHQPDRAGHAGAGGSGTPGDRALQRGDRVPAGVRVDVRGRPLERAAGPRRAQPPDVGAQGADRRGGSPAGVAGGARGPRLARAGVPTRTGSRDASGSGAGARVRSPATTSTTTTTSIACSLPSKRGRPRGPRRS